MHNACNVSRYFGLNGVGVSGVQFARFAVIAFCGGRAFCVFLRCLCLAAGGRAMRAFFASFSVLFFSVSGGRALFCGVRVWQREGGF